MTCLLFPFLNHTRHIAGASISDIRTNTLVLRLDMYRREDRRSGRHDGTHVQYHSTCWVSILPVYCLDRPCRRGRCASRNRFCFSATLGRIVCSVTSWTFHRLERITLKGTALRLTRESCQDHQRNRWVANRSLTLPSHAGGGSTSALHPIASEARTTSFPCNTTRRTTKWFQPGPLHELLPRLQEACR